MEYHEIGEKFEYDGVMLEVVTPGYCKGCFFFDRYTCMLESPKKCGALTRYDNKSVCYKLVEQCKTKENNNMDKKIFYADLTPCDNMQDYKAAVFVPKFVIDDSKEFDTNSPIWVVQLATTCGWCIVAKWHNNGSTRIYGGTDDAIRAGVSILGGCCDSGDCGYAFGEEKIYVKFVSEDDVSVFDGYTDGNIIEGMKREEEKQKYMEQKITKQADDRDKAFAAYVANIQSDEEIYGSLLDKLFTTYKAKNHDYSNAFSEMFDELGIDYAYGKLREKMNRIKVLRNKPNMVENEGLEDALLDTAGYAILTLVELKKRKDNDKSE